MNRFISQAIYAEDQPHSTLILTTHVLHRGSTCGAVLGTLVGTGRKLFLQKSCAPYTILRSTGVGVVAGTAVTAIGFGGMMYGRSDIEWQDRSWRLIGNEKQNRVDEYGAVGMVVGAVVGTVARSGWRGVAGGMGMCGMLATGCGLVGSWIMNRKKEA